MLIQRWHLGFSIYHCHVCYFPINILRRNAVRVGIFIYFFISFLLPPRAQDSISREQAHPSTESGAVSRGVGAGG